MELLFEFIFDLVSEGSLEIAKSKKISKIIRYPLIFIISLFIISIIGLIGFISIALLIRHKEVFDIIAGLLLAFFDGILIISSFKNIKNEMSNKNDK